MTAWGEKNIGQVTFITWDPSLTAQLDFNYKHLRSLQYEFRILLSVVAHEIIHIEGYSFEP